MRSAAWIIVGLTLSAAAFAQRPVSRDEFYAWSERERLMDEIVIRANNVKPRRRDAPLRELNITDNEIREVESLVQEVLPRSMVNISPVVTGCPCEEGRGCTDQLYVMASAGTVTRGLQISKIEGQWRIGAVQSWWLDYERLQTRVRELDWVKSHEQRWEIISKFPSCPGSRSDIQSVLTKSNTNP